MTTRGRMFLSVDPRCIDDEFEECAFFGWDSSAIKRCTGNWTTFRRCLFQDINFYFLDYIEMEDCTIVKCDFSAAKHAELVEDYLLLAYCRRRAVMTICDPRFNVCCRAPASIGCSVSRVLRGQATLPELIRVHGHSGGRWALYGGMAAFAIAVGYLVWRPTSQRSSSGQKA